MGNPAAWMLALWNRCTGRVVNQLPRNHQESTFESTDLTSWGHVLQKHMDRCIWCITGQIKKKNQKMKKYILQIHPYGFGGPLKIFNLQLPHCIQLLRRRSRSGIPGCGFSLSTNKLNRWGGGLRIIWTWSIFHQTLMPWSVRFFESLDASVTSI